MLQRPSTDDTAIVNRRHSDRQWTPQRPSMHDIAAFNGSYSDRQQAPQRLSMSTEAKMTFNRRYIDHHSIQRTDFYSLCLVSLSPNYHLNTGHVHFKDTPKHAKFCSMSIHKNTSFDAVLGIVIIVWYLKVLVSKVKGIHINYDTQLRNLDKSPI